MEGYNATANVDKVWSALVPSLVVVTLFLFIVVLVILAALLSLKILHTLWPRPIPVPVPPRTSEIELAETNIETPRVEEAEGGQDVMHQVRSSEPDNQMVRTTRTPSSDNYIENQAETGANYAEGTGGSSQRT